MKAGEEKEASPGLYLCISPLFFLLFKQHVEPYLKVGTQ